jgi:hypothetical protein
VLSFKDWRELVREYLINIFANERGKLLLIGKRKLFMLKMQ